MMEKFSFKGGLTRKGNILSITGAILPLAIAGVLMVVAPMTEALAATPIPVCKAGIKSTKTKPCTVLSKLKASQQVATAKKSVDDAKPKVAEAVRMFENATKALQAKAKADKTKAQAELNLAKTNLSNAQSDAKNGRSATANSTKTITSAVAAHSKATNAIKIIIEGR